MSLKSFLGYFSLFLAIIGNNVFFALLGLLLIRKGKKKNGLD